jgi:cytochrome c-type biogenesis protein CcmH
MFWVTLTLLSLAAIVFAVWPLWRGEHRLSPLVATVVVFVVALSAGLYDRIGSPGVPSGRDTGDEVHGMGNAIASLEQKLQRNPDDVAGWKMLARSHSAMRNYAGAASAYEKAMALEGGQVAQTLIDLALSLSSRDQRPLEDRMADLVENALVLEPNNQAALFYAGMTAANREDFETAANRWDKLLGMNPPEDIRETLAMNVAIWRGEEPAPTQDGAGMVSPEAPGGAPAEEAGDNTVPGAIVSARVALSEEAMRAIKGNAFVFIIARDPAAPTPPIAVKRHTVNELPLVVGLSDADSMVAGRTLSAFADLEVLARVSLSGGPGAASGDWYGSKIVRPAETSSINLIIDQQVP